MNTIKLLRLVGCVVGVTLVTAVNAAPRQIEGWVAGGGARYGNDDNVTERQTNEVEEDFAELDAALGFGFGSDKNFIEMLIEANSRDHEDNDTYDREQAAFTGVVQWQPNESNRIELHGAHQRVEENQDQTNRDNLEINGDEYFYSDAGIVAHLGHGRNLIAAEVGINHHWRRYLVNRRGGSQNALKDRDVASANLSVFYQFSPYFRLVLTGKYDDYDYIEKVGGNDNRLNSENVSGVFGIEWEDESSRLWLRGGVEEKEFDSNTLDKGDMGIWQLGYVGKLSESTGFEISSTARLLEGSTVEEYVEQIATELKFNAAITDTVAISLGYVYSDEEFVDSCTTLTAGPSTSACYKGREDTLKEVKFRLHYNFMEDLAVGVDYRFSERESNLADRYNYERNVVSLFVESSL